MADQPQDWHPEDIKAAIRKTGITLSDLSTSGGFHPHTVALALGQSIPRAEALVAKRLGVRPQDIWPSRYDETGAPRRGLHSSAAKATRRPRYPHRQKEKAART